MDAARVRTFAKSEGIKAQADQLDARMRLRFAQSKAVEPSPVPSAERRALQALMDRRSQVTEMLAREKTRLKKAPELAHASLEKMIEFIEDERNLIQAQIQEQIESNSEMEEQNRVMQTVIGVGPTTA